MNVQAIDENGNVIPWSIVGSGGPAPATSGSVGTVPTTVATVTAAATPVVLTNVIQVILENTGSMDTTISYGGVDLVLPGNGGQRTFSSVYDRDKKKWTPIAALVVNGGASYEVVVIKNFLQ